MSKYLDKKKKNDDPEIIDKVSTTEIVVESPARKTYSIKTMELNKILNGSVYGRKAKITRKRKGIV